MPSLQPPPPTPTRLSTPVGPETPIGGDVQVAPGVGTWTRPTADNTGLVVDADVSPPGFQLNHFHPGAVATGLVRAWRVPSHLLGVVASQLEVHVLNPASVVTNGHHVVRVEGSLSGSADLDLNVADQQLYRLELTAPEELADRGTGSALSGPPRSIGAPFSVSEVTTITDVGYDFTQSTAGRRIGILDEAGEWLAFRDFAGTWGANTPFLARMPRSVECQPGIIYTLGIERLEAGGAMPEHRGMWDDQTGSPVNTRQAVAHPLSPDELTSVDAHATIFVNADEPDGRSLKDAMHRSDVYNRDTSHGYGWGRHNWGRFLIAGRGEGLSISGDDIRVRILESGAPDEIPADVNFRVDADPGS